MPDYDLEIRPFRPEDQAKARHVILLGLAERWGTLNPELNTDLKNIAHSYQNGVFLVAHRDNELIGTGAFLHMSTDVVQIVRMTVAANARQLGIGRRIFQELCRYARDRDCKSVILETTDTWTDAIEFYERCGCRRTFQKDGNQYFVLDL